MALLDNRLSEILVSAVVADEVLRVQEVSQRATGVIRRQLADTVLKLGDGIRGDTASGAYALPVDLTSLDIRAGGLLGRQHAAERISKARVASKLLLDASAVCVVVESPTNTCPARHHARHDRLA